MASKYVKQVVLGEEGDEDSTAALSPQQIADQLVQIDPDDLFDLQAAIDKNLQRRTTASAGHE